MTPADKDNLSYYNSLLADISGGDWVVSRILDGTIVLEDKKNVIYSEATRKALERLNKQVP